MQAVLAQLVQSQTLLQEQVAHQARLVEAYVRASEENNALLREAAVRQTEAVVRESERRGLQASLDKAVGRPPAFGGDPKEWNAWSFKFVTWMSAQFERGGEALDWAHEKGDETITLEMVAELARLNPEAQTQKMNSQLHIALVALTVQGSEAFDLVRNAVKGCGFDAWRRLTKKYDPNNPQRNMMLLKKVLQPQRASIQGLQQIHRTMGTGLLLLQRANGRRTQ